MLDHLIDGRNLLLFGHIVGAILFLGSLTSAASRFPAVAAAHDGRSPTSLPAARELHRTTRAYGPAAGVVPVLGFVLAAQDESFGELWLQVSVALVAVAGLLLFAVIIPEQSTVIARMASGDAAPIERGELARLRAATGAFSLLWAIVVLFMVAKPT